MPSKAPKSQWKIGRCVRKKIDAKDFLVFRISGKVPAATMRELKAHLNDAVADFMQPVEDSPKEE